MDKYDVSFIVTTYNSVNTLERLFTSIVEQRAKPSFEVVFVDDGSTDQTGQLIKHYVTQYPNVSAYFQSNQGPSAARNRGIAAAAGTFVTFADDDDEYAPSFLHDAWQASATKKLVITGISRITGAHQVEEQTKPATQAATSKTKLLQAYLVHNQEMDVGPWAKLYDRQLLHDQQLRFANQGRFEDSLFNLCFLEQLEPNEIGFVNKPEYFLYKRSGSLTNSYEPELEKKCTTYVHQVAKIVGNPDLPAYFSSFELRMALYFINRNILTNQDWSARAQSEVLGKRITIQALRFLTKQYQVAAMLAFIFPRLYIRMYKKRNGV